jgi:hypothetical protein
MCIFIRKFANSPPYACRGSSGQKPQYLLMALEYQRFKIVLLLIYLSGWRLLLSECVLRTLVTLPPIFALVSCPAYSSALKVEAMCSSETSVDFQRTARHYIPEDSALHNHRCENLKSYNQ